MKMERVESRSDAVWAKSADQPHSRKAHCFCASALGWRASRCGFLVPENLLVEADRGAQKCKTCERLVLGVTLSLDQK